MAVYKDKKRGTWYTSVMYKEWENHFTMKEASNLDMTFGDFVKVWS